MTSWVQQRNYDTRKSSAELYAAVYNYCVASQHQNVQQKNSEYFTKAKELLKLGANPNAIQDSGTNALHVAVIFNNLAMAKLLLGDGKANVNMATRGDK